MSQDERLRILQMVQDGVITPPEAEALLLAPDDHTTAPEHVSPRAKKKKRSLDAPPDMDRFRRFWEYPFMVGLLLLAVSGFCATNAAAPLLVFCGWGVFVVALVIALIGWASQWSPWVHVRIHENDGSRIAISLPLPLRLIGVLTDFAMAFVRPFTDKETSENIEMAVSFIAMLEDESLDEPITIDVDEEDGDHIQVFLG